MTNVVHLHGAMNPRHYVRIGKLTEAEIDAQIASNRERYDTACEAAAVGLPVPISTRRQPSLIPLDNSLLARAARWLRKLSIQLRSPL